MTAIHPHEHDRRPAGIEADRPALSYVALAGAFLATLAIMLVAAFLAAGEARGAAAALLGG